MSNDWRNRPGTKSAGEAIDQFAKRAGFRRGLRRAQVVLAWERIAGSDMLHFTHAKRFQDGVLYVDVSDAETATHLQFERRRYLRQFKQHGFNEVTDIRFGVGMLPPRDDSDSPPPDVPADPALVTRLLDSVEQAGLPSEIAEAAREAALSYAKNQARKRASGATPCAVCGALHMGHERPLSLQDEAQAEAGRRVTGVILRQLCISCRTHAVSLRTTRLSHDLIIGVDREAGRATEEELAVARFLAVDYLAEMLERLAAEVVRYPAARSQLRELADRYLDLRTAPGEPPAPEHELSEHVRRMLST